MTLKYIFSIKFVCINFLILWSCNITIAQKSSYHEKCINYIEKYKPIAIEESKRSGIPAAITLAQGIHESGVGNSALAKEANNHFGIKVTSRWTGAYYELKDDDYIDGELIKSKFRVYATAQKSYSDHTDFLTNNGNPARYASLFLLDRRDYVGWANGLKTAGYATDPNYASKLIHIIEKYQLYQIDENIKDHDVVNALQHSKEQDIAVYQYAAKTSDNQPQKKIDLRSEFHIVKEGETIESIAEMYKIELYDLLFQNRIGHNEEPLIGEKLRLKDYYHLKKLPKTHKKQPIKESFLFDNQPIIVVSK